VSDWERLGSVAPKELSDSRVQLHWAAQLVAAVGASLVPARPDDSHTALSCIVEKSLLVSEATSASPSRRVALSLSEPRIVVLDAHLNELSGMALDGNTLESALAWIASQLGGASLTLPDYDMPPHPIQEGAAFRFEPRGGFDELGRWYRNAALVLRGLDLGHVRCWPYHFDLASLITLDGDQSIGVGLSPGDGSYDEPYWYVTPWPYPTTNELPDLPAGHWHREGFVAAILTGSRITAGDAAGQEANVSAFLEAAIASSRQLLA